MTDIKLKKGAYITDIHFGKKANSELHNQDCIRVLEWFRDEVRNDPDINYIAFLGDWHENRSALNISTLNYSCKGAQILNEIGLPVFFVIGNHDLYHRHTREVHSVVPFHELDNFHVISEPTVIDDTLFSPFMFPDEYPDLVEFNKVPIWAGHFEFKGFQLTGYGMVMPTGPDPKDFTKQKRIFSGHFHKRQWGGNIIYIGNAFPMDFSDSDDAARGMMVYEHETNEPVFINWPDCPKYTRTTLSDIMDGCTELLPDMTVECIVDVDITFEEYAYLRQKYIDDYQLRDLQLEEQTDLDETISGDDNEIDIDHLASTNDLVIEMLKGIETDKLDNDLLIQIYTKIPTQ